MDPYIKLFMGSIQFQSKTATNHGKMPKWNEEYTFEYTSGQTRELKIEAYDKDIG